MAKTVLITGTSNGFGADIATTLAAAGHRVFATMREMSGRNREAASTLQARGIETIELDVTDNASTDAAFNTLLAITLASRLAVFQRLSRRSNYATCLK
jgi:NAD(P)-dependent dehydrogenase (short-subunit alcohol dehydrogenase family)